MDYNQTLSGLFSMYVQKFVEQVCAKAKREEFPFIITHSGTKFRHGWPAAEDVKIEDIAHALARLCRFTGHISVPHYSVAQHSVLVSRACDPADALWGLLHDAAEAYVGDMSSPLKNMPGMEAFKYYERLTQRAVIAKFDLPEVEPPSVKHADMRLLLTEMRDLFTAPVAHQWADERYQQWPPLAETITALGPLAAERAFLRRFYELADYHTVIAAIYEATDWNGLEPYNVQRRHSTL